MDSKMALGIRNLAEQLDGARLVRSYVDVGIVWAWFGGATVNCYSLEDASEVDMFMMDVSRTNDFDAVYEAIGNFMCCEFGHLEGF